VKCYVHLSEDAVGICKVCGRGVCQKCAVIVAETVHCKTCAETGRIGGLAYQISMQPIAVPKPSGAPSRTPFIMGGVGAILTGVGAILSTSGGLGGLFFFGGYLGTGGALGIAANVLLAVGLIIAGLGYNGIRTNYGLAIGIVCFAFSIVASVWILITAILGTTSFLGSSNYALWNPIFIMPLVLLATVQITGGVTHINSRQYTGNPGLGMTTGTMLIISGALTATVLFSFVGFVLLFVSEILTTITFLTSNVPRQV